MKQKTQQRFISVSAVYAPKNNLEKHGSNELNRLNNLLCADLKEAKELIQKAVDQATAECPTSKRCKPLKIQYWEANGDGIGCRVNDLISFSIDPVFIRISAV